MALSGENGILVRSVQAKEKSEQAKLEEEIKLKINEREIEKSQGDTRTLGEYLSKISKANVQELDSDVWYVTRNTASATVYETGYIIQGKVEVWDGISTEVPEIEGFVWNIYNGAQMKFFADFVNNGNTLTEEQKGQVSEKGYSESDITITDETTVNLMNNIDLGAREKDGTLVKGTAWTPIGIKLNLKFTGTFEGNNNSIRGVYVKVEGNMAGIFGISDTIQNLTVVNSYIEATGTVAGAIVGVLKEGKVYNCHNVNTKVVTGNFSARRCSRRSKWNC